MTINEFGIIEDIEIDEFGNVVDDDCDDDADSDDDDDVRVPTHTDNWWFTSNGFPRPVRVVMHDGQLVAERYKALHLVPVRELCALGEWGPVQNRRYRR
jgi:hypothetical protein